MNLTHLGPAFSLPAGMLAHHHKAVKPRRQGLKRQPGARRRWPTARSRPVQELRLEDSESEEMPVRCGHRPTRIREKRVRI